MTTLAGPDEGAHCCPDHDGGLLDGDEAVALAEWLAQPPGPDT